MNETSEAELLTKAKIVLDRNDRKLWTVPASDLYPHQWLWDSCFIAIGLRHLSVERAQTEILSLLRGQWTNGMLPNIVFSPQHSRRERELWRSYLSPYAPRNPYTSGLTQPPMVAEAVVRIGKKMNLPERRSWYAKVYPHLIRYHEWIYAERDPHQEGLALLLHPYESGLDNSPPWISELRKHSMPWWVSLIEKIHLDTLVNHFRRDTRHVPPGERMSNIEALAYWAALLRLRRKAYNSEAILSRSLFAVEDLAFNCILIRANACLKEIADTIGKPLPESQMTNMSRTMAALEQLWDEDTGQYYSRSFASHKLIEEPTIATLLPLYAGCISAQRVARLVELLNKPRFFRSNWPAPSVPVSSPHFDPIKYWQGPTWVNVNWLIIDGLRRNGLYPEAEKLRQKTLALVVKSGMNEYFNPLTGQPAGAANFSWTASLTIDLLKQG
ncbi:glycoside hydrolase [Candidatus Saccharibacteria bacterium]|nr:glycoside hydrolase [Candidatus Saccharibacteria bacterium]